MNYKAHDSLRLFRLKSEMLCDKKNYIGTFHLVEKKDNTSEV